ncbi:hypothetical protein GQ43DRAFT_125987 [Delitschia confertaspora ATCC 74209]|uniref:SprT-like domain-containing protein n=1 Tax=Delitschia confertaspora ATCC 74209 TaxID=1513339 RepID=A0A9P4JGW9_9PLEO|nr:hypothetical protein GQ43DRAFT_125987 [Delitschia confertaspora ATCC 74209]
MAHLKMGSYNLCAYWRHPDFVDISEPPAPMTYNTTLPLIKRSGHLLVGLPGYSYGLEPDPYSRQKTFSVAPYKRGAVRARSHLRDVKFQCDRNLGWNIEYATAYIVNHLDPANSPKAAEFLANIRRTAHEVEKTNATQMREIAFRTFASLDKVLFNSNLKDAVFLDVQNLGYHVSGATCNPGEGFNRQVPRISIVLNTEMHNVVDSDTILANLIHHMIHAYFLVACGPQRADEVGYGRLAHGIPFANVLYAIKKLTPSKEKPLPLSFGHKLNHPSGMMAPYFNPYIEADIHHQGGPFPNDWHCSYCPARVKSISEADANGWYDGMSKPLLELPECAQKATVHVLKDDKLVETPRTQTLAPGDSVELIFEGKAVLIATERVNAYESVAAVFEKTRWLTIPEGTSNDVFMTLLEFLHSGSFSPDPAPVLAPGRKGPPLIQPVQTDSPPFLLAAIRLFKLASGLKFDDIKMATLDRMENQYITREDPIAILKEIYDPNSPEPDALLRDWATKFLTQQLNPQQMSLFHYQPGVGAITNHKEPPNLVKLQCDFSFHSRYLELLEKSAAFHVDVIKASDALRLQPPPTSIVHPGGLPILPPCLQPSLPSYHLASRIPSIHPSISVSAPPPRRPDIFTAPHMGVRDDIDLRTPKPGLWAGLSGYDPLRSGAVSADPFRTRRLSPPFGPREYVDPYYGAEVDLEKIYSVY